MKASSGHKEYRVHLARTVVQRQVVMVLASDAEAACREGAFLADPGNFETTDITVESKVEDVERVE